EAKAIWPDAKLVRIDASGVRPTGLAELTLSDDFYVRYWYQSDAASQRPADLPRGMEYEATCNLSIFVYKDNIRLSGMDGWECEEEAVPPPRCSVKQAWERAVKVGAPSDNVIAEIGYRVNI